MEIVLNVSEQLRLWPEGLSLSTIFSASIDQKTDFQIPVTVHIIFRSGGESRLQSFLEINAHLSGLCVSMLTGYMFARKRYSYSQIVSYTFCLVRDGSQLRISSPV